MVDGEGGVAGDAEEGGVRLLGAGLAREEVVKDDTVAVLSIGVDVDDGQRGALATKQVESIDGLQRCLGHPNGAGGRGGGTQQQCSALVNTPCVYSYGKCCVY